MIEKSVWGAQNVARFLVAYDEWVYSTASDSGSAMLTWTVEIVGHVDSRSRSDVSAERSACERRKRNSCRKAFFLINELVMFAPKNKGEVQNCIGIVLGLVNRSDEVLGGTIERARIVRRMPEGQRGDARDAKSAGGVPRQQESVQVTPQRTDACAHFSRCMSHFAHFIQCTCIGSRCLSSLQNHPISAPCHPWVFVSSLLSLLSCFRLQRQ